MPNARRVTVFRAVPSHGRGVIAPDLVRQAVAGDPAAALTLIERGGYTALGDAVLVSPTIPRSQIGDLVIDHEDGRIHLSVVDGHRAVGPGILDHHGLTTAALDPSATYAIRFQTRALPLLVSALTALRTEPAVRIADMVRAGIPFVMPGRDVIRSLAQALDTAGRLNLGVECGHALPSQAVTLTDVVTRITLMRATEEGAIRAAE
jgi:hypothetical protein